MTDKEKLEDSKKWPQYLAVLTASLASFSCGTHYAWPSAAFANSDFPQHISVDEQSYIAMIQSFGDVAGCVLMAVLADKIGRKMGILLMVPPLIIPWIIIYFTRDTILYCIARFIFGVADGFFFIVMPMYIGEVTEPSVRGVLGCTIAYCYILGMILINYVGAIMTIKNSALICISSPLLLLLLFIWMPETPTYLIMKNRIEDAQKSMYFLRRCNVTAALESLKTDVKQQKSETGTLKDLFTVKNNRKALIVLLGVRIMQQGCGGSVFGILTQVIFEDAKASDPMFLSNMYIVINLVMTIVGSFLVDKFGRKPLLLISNLGCGIILYCGALYFYLFPAIDQHQWFPITIMLVFSFVFAIGLGTVPPIFLGELFSTSIKSVGLCFMCIFYALMITVTVQIYYMLYSVGLYATFLIFGSLGFLSTIWGYFYIPETKDKSLEEIQNMLREGKTK